MDTKERNHEIVKRFLDGESMSEISKAYGISRERVRQLLSKRGLSAENGGFKLAALARREASVNAAMQKMIERFGCTLEQRRAIPKLARQQFQEQRRNSHDRGIEWKLTMWDWWCIWRDSGHWEQRGRNLGQYVMARERDKGPYEVGNVAIVTKSENSTYSRDGTLKERDRKRSEGIWYATSHPRTPWRATYRHKHIGFYKTEQEAEIARKTFMQELASRV